MEKPKPVIPPTLVGPPSVKPQATRMARPFDAVDEDEPLPTRPLFDTVEHREPPPMLFDTVEPREVAPPPVAPPRAPAPARPAPLFDTVEPRDFGASHGALFDTVEPRVPAPAAPPPKPVIPPPPAPAPAPAPPAGVAAPVRISLGSKGEYSLNKIVRKHDDGVEELLCYELMRNGKPVQRGTQEQIRQAFKEALAGS
jgi:hypothetical protein